MTTQPLYAVNGSLDDWWLETPSGEINLIGCYLSRHAAQVARRKLMQWRSAEFHDGGLRESPQSNPHDAKSRDRYIRLGVLNVH